jgi:pyruvate dehydrogenase E2 component (dihydrolipoamide acetyltransferase)
MPALSPTMTEGKLAKWHVKEGDTVKSGTGHLRDRDRQGHDGVEAVDEGKVGKILVEEGTEGVKVNAVIAVLLEEGETEAAKPAAPAAAPAPKAEQKPRRETSREAGRAGSQAGRTSGGSTGGARIFASPLAKRIAAEKGIDLGGIKGSGPNGRIVKADVENAKPGAAPAAAQAPKAAVKAPAPPAGGQPVFVAPGDSRVPHTSIRKVIARRMLESKQTVPHFYLTVDFEIDALLTARTAINAVVEKKGTKVSVNDMVIKACAKALRDHPECQRLVDRGRDDPVRRGRHLGRRRHRSRPHHADRAQCRHEGPGADLDRNEGPRQPRQERQAEA